jgi:large-conductance mechanosensitive channel
MESFYQNFQKFALQNNVLASTAGFSIGIATKELIERILTHVGFQSIGTMSADSLTKYVGNVPYWARAIMLIVGDILVWLAIILFTFIIAFYVMQRIIVPDIPKNITITLVNSKEEATQAQVIGYEK